LSATGASVASSSLGGVVDMVASEPDGGHHFVVIRQLLGVVDHYRSAGSIVDLVSTSLELQPPRQVGIRCPGTRCVPLNHALVELVILAIEISTDAHAPAMPRLAERDLESMQETGTTEAVRVGRDAVDHLPLLIFGMGLAFQRILQTDRRQTAVAAQDA